MRVDFSNLPRWTNRAFYPLYRDRRRVNVIYGGAGSGKSFFLSERVVYRTVAKLGHNYLVLRKTGRTSRISTFSQILQVINLWGLGSIFVVNKTDMEIRCRNGNTIRFAGLDDVEKIKSTTFPNGPLTDIWVEEANEITEDDYTQLTLRLRGKARVPFQITLSFNPISALHWIKARLFDTPQDPEHCTILKTTYKDNRFIDDAYRAELEALKDVDRTFYQVYALGQWGVLGGLVFDNWEARKCPYTPDQFDTIVAGQDFGFNHKNAIELIGIKDGNLYSFNELWISQMTNTEVIERVTSSGLLAKTQICTADSAEPDRIKEWRKAGYYMRPAKKGKHSVKYGIDFLKSKKWYVDPEMCPGLLAELQTYKWAEDPDGNLLDEPVSFRDDAIAACRYAVEHLWHKGSKTSANFNRARLKI